MHAVLTANVVEGRLVLAVCILAGVTVIGVAWELARRHMDHYDARSEFARRHRLLRELDGIEPIHHEPHEAVRFTTPKEQQHHD